MNSILDNVIFTEQLTNYFNNKDILPTVHPDLQPYVNIIDDYRNDQQLFKLHDIRFKFRSSGTFVISSIGLDTNNKIQNITNKRDVCSKKYYYVIILVNNVKKLILLSPIGIKETKTAISDGKSQIEIDD